MADKNRIMQRMQEHYKVLIDKGYEVVGLFLQGSQNYGLDYENSDIDTKAIILPSFNSFALNERPISYTHIMENEEHIDVKDIRVMFENIKKQNINFVEILFTEYYILNPVYEELFKPMILNREIISKYNITTALNCMCGMALEKKKAMCHPYPSVVKKIEEFGYDSKQLHHIFRMFEFMNRFISGESYEKCLIADNKELLIDIKRSKTHTLEQAKYDADLLCDKLKKMKDVYLLENVQQVNTDAEDIMQSVVVNILKESIKNYLMQEKNDDNKSN